MSIFFYQYRRHTGETDILNSGGHTYYCLTEDLNSRKSMPVLSSLHTLFHHCPLNFIIAHFISSLRTLFHHCTLYFIIVHFISSLRTLFHLFNSTFKLYFTRSTPHFYFIKDCIIHCNAPPPPPPPSPP